VKKNYILADAIAWKNKKFNWDFEVEEGNKIIFGH